MQLQSAVTTEEENRRLLLLSGYGRWPSCLVCAGLAAGLATGVVPGKRSAAEAAAAGWLGIPLGASGRSSY